MSGRGKPGGGLVRTHKPEDVEVTLSLRTTVSTPTLSLTLLNRETSNPAPNDLCIQIHASAKSSTHPSLPITLSTWRTPLERPFNPSDGSASPVWINSALSYLRSTSDPSRKGGPPELGYIIDRRGGLSRNLREDWDFLTVPSADSGQEVVVHHSLPLEKLQFWQHRDDGYRNEVKPEKGEVFVIAPNEGALGTFWWRWGDLEGDLRAKKFLSDEWFDGEGGIRRGDEENEQWVTSEGKHGFGLTMEVATEAKIEFV